MKISARMQTFVMRDLGINKSNMSIVSMVWKAIEKLQNVSIAQSLIKAIRAVCTVESLAAVATLVSIHQNISYFQKIRDQSRWSQQ